MELAELNDIAEKIDIEKKIEEHDLARVYWHIDDLDAAFRMVARFILAKHFERLSKKYGNDPLAAHYKEAAENYYKHLPHDRGLGW